MITVNRRRMLMGAAALSAGSVMPRTASAQTVTLDVQYPFPSGNNKEFHEDIASRFMAENPDVEISFRAPAQNYEDASQQVLRGAIVDQMPDVSFQGLNLLRVLVDREMAVPLGRFIEADGGAEELGYAPALLDTVRHGGDIYGVPLLISTPVLYVNADLVRAAGVDPDGLPNTWEDLVALGRTIDDPERNRTGFYYQWDITGNWMWQALVFSRGGRMLSADERRIAFDGPEGQWALETLERFAQAGMPNLPFTQARPAFKAGNIGLYAESSSHISAATAAIDGQFDFQVRRFPMSAPEGRIPAGGALGVILTQDPARQEAAWRYLRFATGPVGQTLMVEHTGYMPSNQKAIADPDLLGRFYEEHPNHQTSVDQLSVMTAWYAFPGDNAVKIIDVIKDHLEAVVTGQRPAADVMPAMAGDVRGLIG